MAAMMMTPAQCRAARALLDWTQERLASATGLSVPTVRTFEKGGDSRESTQMLIRLRLQEAGVEFIPEDSSGVGVRLREPEGKKA